VPTAFVRLVIGKSLRGSESRCTQNWGRIARYVPKRLLSWKAGGDCRSDGLSGVPAGKVDDGGFCAYGRRRDQRHLNPDDLFIHSHMGVKSFLSLWKMWNGDWPEPQGLFHVEGRTRVCDSRFVKRTAAQLAQPKNRFEFAPAILFQSLHAIFIEENLAETAIYPKRQNKFEVLWKTLETNSFCLYECPAVKSPKPTVTTDSRKRYIRWNLPPSTRCAVFQAGVPISTIPSQSATSVLRRPKCRKRYSRAR
jgi:hypothetical protein